MTTDGPRYEAIVIGGGFYGCEIASYLVDERGFRKILIVEQEENLMSRASLRNQARVHGGYHYPRDFVTAHRSSISRPKFCERYPSAIISGLTSVYAVARSGSHVRPDVFSRRMREAGATLREPRPAIRHLFSDSYIDAVFEVDEDVFDSVALKAAVEKKIRGLGVDIALKTRAVGMRNGRGGIEVATRSMDGPISEVSARYVFNCTYAGLNTVDSGKTVSSGIKHEIAELALVTVPNELEGLGITVMDGAFFSILPYPPAPGKHSLSHVRYTPQASWVDDGTTSPYSRLDTTQQDSRSVRMLRDSSRYVPLLAQSIISGGFREVKTVLVENEENDGRPILIEKSPQIRGLYSILGAKIDNIFDVFEYLSTEDLRRGETK